MQPSPAVAGRTMKVPGPDHPIAIEPYRGRVLVRAGGRILADSRAALKLTEASYPPVFYLPRADADMAALAPSDHTTYCPYKGPCSYLSIPAAGERGVNAVWSYESPYPAVALIAGHLAFYPDRVQIEATEE